MTKEIEIALPGKEQGNKTLNIDNNVNNVYKTFDVPDSSLPGCYGMYGDPGEYKGLDGCIACEHRLTCARMSAGGRQ